MIFVRRASLSDGFKRVVCCVSFTHVHVHQPYPLTLGLRSRASKFTDCGTVSFLWIRFLLHHSASAVPPGTFWVYPTLRNARTRATVTPLNVAVALTLSPSTNLGVPPHHLRRRWLVQLRRLQARLWLLLYQWYPSTSVAMVTRTPSGSWVIRPRATRA